MKFHQRSFQKDATTVETVFTTQKQESSQIMLTNFYEMPVNFLIVFMVDYW